MDRRYSAQDIVRCTLCLTSVAPMYCEVCNINLCKDCVETHLSDLSNVHNVVSLKQYITTLKYPKCMKHPIELCKRHCKECDIPICDQCDSLEKHSGHLNVDIIEHFESEKEILQKDLRELEKFIYPRHHEIVSSIPVQKAELSKCSDKMKIDLNKRSDVWHREIDLIIINMKYDVNEAESKHLSVLNRHEDKISNTISDIKQIIAKLKRLQNSRDVRLVSEYKSRNAEFRRLPPKLEVSLPNFVPQKIDRDQLTRQIGSMSASSLITKEQDYIMPQEPVSTFQRLSSRHINVPHKIDAIDTGYVPRVLTAIDTGYVLHSVACLSDSEIWTCGSKKIMKLFNLQRELVESVNTESGNKPSDIAVTRRGNLVYTDENNRTVNIMKKSVTQTVIRLRQWIPRGVCSSSFGDLLVIMDSKDYKQTKVVRYSGSTDREKQSIQYNDRGQPLYLVGNDKYITENRNEDICVSDYRAHAVVVVNHAGKLRFKYAGQPASSKNPFCPYGITSDSHSRILTADFINECIHILDQDGQFLRFINNCNLQHPEGLCIDTKDNLFVAEYHTGKVKKIQYCM
ncbi:tripartite motif-containing protein 2-like [Magallana gigas]|uniref:tripartite motif-containing protein 2-like n=1 Tax=Magallana gigas TaxID=29159 RepID=UPI0033416A80